MNNQSTSDLDIEAIVRGLEEAYRRMIIFKRQKNSPVVVMVDGEIKEVDPYKMPSTTTYHY